VKNPNGDGGERQRGLHRKTPNQQKVDWAHGDLFSSGTGTGGLFWATQINHCVIEFLSANTPPAFIPESVYQMKKDSRVVFKTAWLSFLLCTWRSYAMEWS